jgi:ABC-type sugar transport system ATPase subunit
VEARDFKTDFGEVFVLKGVDLSIEEREFPVLPCSSGSGKTTLGRIIAGLERPTAGETFREVLIPL